MRQAGRRPYHDWLSSRRRDKRLGQSLILEWRIVEEQIGPSMSAALLQICSPTSGFLGFGGMSCKFLRKHLIPLGRDCPTRSRRKRPLWMPSAKEFWLARLRRGAFSEVAPTLCGTPLSEVGLTPPARPVFWKSLKSGLGLGPQQGLLPHWGGPQVVHSLGFSF